MLYSTPMPKFEKNQVGQVHVSITVANHIDQILAERGFIPTEEVRTLALDNVLVDTGATLLCLPTEMIEQLGLPEDSEVYVNTSAGRRRGRVFRDANLTINGRRSTFDCLELTEIDQPLLGVIPLERLGLQPDLQNQKLISLPTEEEASYLYA